MTSKNNFLAFQTSYPMEDSRQSLWGRAKGYRERIRDIAHKNLRSPEENEYLERYRRKARERQQKCRARKKLLMNKWNNRGQAAWLSRYDAG